MKEREREKFMILSLNKSRLYSLLMRQKTKDSSPIHSFFYSRGKTYEVALWLNLIMLERLNQMKEREVHDPILEQVKTLSTLYSWDGRLKIPPFLIHSFFDSVGKAYSVFSTVALFFAAWKTDQMKEREVHDPILDQVKSQLLMTETNWTL